MNHAEVEELLRTRWRLTGQRFSDDKIDAWHKVLEPYDADRITARLNVVVRQGHSDNPRPDWPELADLTGGIKPDNERRTHPDRCWHSERTEITETHSRCNYCRADLYSANDPRIAGQWEHWVELGRQDRINHYRGEP